MFNYRVTQTFQTSSHPEASIIIYTLLSRQKSAWCLRFCYPGPNMTANKFHKPVISEQPGDFGAGSKLVPCQRALTSGSGTGYENERNIWRKHLTHQLLML